jgi:hypothetical protein
MVWIIYLPITTQADPFQIIDRESPAPVATQEYVVAEAVSFIRLTAPVVAIVTVAAVVEL